MKSEEKELQGLLGKKKVEPEPKIIRYKYRRLIIKITPMKKKKFHFSVDMAPFFPWTLTSVKQSKSGNFHECMPAVKKHIDSYIAESQAIEKF